jgi:NAD(P)-dependent dehydrogenase (short-subunit alcohol dehydrogenase family)
MANPRTSMIGFEGRVAIVTGGSKGIGEGAARAFTAAGATTVICARGQEAGEALASELTAKGPGKCSFMSCDVTKREDIRNVVEATVRDHGRLDCLVNNAGWHPPHLAIDDFSIDEFEELLRLNLVSYFAFCKFALPYLRQTKGSIINMSSLVGAMAQEWATTYCATKGGITALTKALAIDEARFGVRVNAVLPGNIATPLEIGFINSKPNPQEVAEYIDSWQWAGRRGTSEEVGEACLFLASDQASYITGVELIVSGGSELGYGVKWPKGGPTLRL